MALSALIWRMGKYEQHDAGIRDLTRAARRHVSQVQSAWLADRQARAAQKGAVMDIAERLTMWIEGERDAKNFNHVRHLTQALGELQRLRGVLGLARHRLSRTADAVSDGDLSDPRVDQLSDFAIEVEELIYPKASGGLRPRYSCGWRGYPRSRRCSAGFRGQDVVSMSAVLNILAGHREPPPPLTIATSDAQKLSATCSFKKPRGPVSHYILKQMVFD